MLNTVTSTVKNSIDETIEGIENDLEKKSLLGVSDSIDNWINTLNGNDGLKEIASNLKDLKEAVSAKDGKKIVELLTSLGEQTTEAAGIAKGDDAHGVTMLGKALTSAAHTIGKWM
jgi:hypothetical protein